MTRLSSEHTRHDDAVVVLFGAGFSIPEVASVLRRSEGTVCDVLRQHVRPRQAAPVKPVTPARVMQASGADRVVLDVIRDGADTIKAITAGAKMAPRAAGHVVRRLIASGKVIASGATSTRRYRAKKP